MLPGSCPRVQVRESGQGQAYRIDRLAWGWKDGSMVKVLATHRSSELQNPCSWDTRWTQRLACNSTLGQQSQGSPEQARHAE